MSIELYILILISYLLGSIPFGLIISKLNGVDIRLHGSKNIGATNVFKSIGKKYGLTTFFLDTLKGFIPTYYFPMFLIDNQFNDIGILFGILSIIGHTFPIFLAFKGGKGVATSAGMLFGIAPIALFNWIFDMDSYVNDIKICFFIIHFCMYNSFINSYI